MLALPAPAIVGGTATTTEEWPWQGHLTIKAGYGCGATLIDRRIALTAAHCVESIAGDELYLRFGRADLSQPEKREVAATVQEVYVSRHWSQPGDSHDFALLLLEQRVNTVEPIRLATSSDAASFEVGDPAWITGWGATGGGWSTMPSNVLMEAEVSLADCRALGVDESSFFCTSGAPTVCTGDSGGPLMIGTRTGKFRQIGVTSFGDGNCEVIGAFTNVTGGPARAELDAALAELRERPVRPEGPGGPPPGPPPPIGAGPPPHTGGDNR